MNHLRKYLRLPAIVSLFLLPGAAAAIDPYPLDYFALREVMSSVSVSPDGKRLALLAIPNKDGNPILEVYDAGDLEKEPIRVDADKMEIRSAQWASNNDIIMSLRQRVRSKIDDFNQGVYETRIARLNVDRLAMETFNEENPVIESVLPHQDNKVILSMQPGGSSEEDSRLAEAFRPRAYYLFDLEKGTKSLLIRGKIDLGNIDFDEFGNPWLGRGFDLRNGEFVWYRRSKDGNKWQEFHRLHEDSVETFNVVGVDPQDPDSVIVVAENGQNTQALWSFNTIQKKFGEMIYHRKDVDVVGVRFHSNPWTNADTITGIVYYKDRYHFEYFDDLEAATYAQLDELIPNAYYTRITSRSRDGQTLTIMNTAPTDPGSYYLIKDGALKKVGSQQPLLSPEMLANVEYITYPSRDGLSIPAFITRPKGDGPYPLIVMPHGGPFVQETVDYDEWSQMFANNGYMVLQPQYRGSLGYGGQFYLAAIKGGGQGGYKMQDDKDDGALYLVEQGLVDKDRIAMYGWSYGGYAALVAASRTPQIYQCVIAGAAVSDTQMQVNYYRNQLRGHGRDQQLSMWTDSINPINEVEKVNVPMMIIHGSVDQRVPPAHARKYTNLLDKYGKNYKYVELDGADHFYNTLFYNHQSLLYRSLIDYLQNDCGPGGL